MTYEFSLKCMACGLHYKVFSWQETWGEGNAKYGFCPECGVKGRKIVWGPDSKEKQIFELVPGNSTLSFMGL